MGKELAQYWLAINIHKKRKYNIMIKLIKLNNYFYTIILPYGNFYKLVPFGLDWVFHLKKNKMSKKIFLLLILI